MTGKPYFCICLLSVGFLHAVAQVKPTVLDWRNDIETMAHNVQAIHPAPFARIGKLEFLRRVNALKAELPQLTEEQRVVRAMQLLALIGDTHTQLEPDRPDFADWYPVRIYEFTDGYFVTATHKSVSELAGAQVLEVAGRPVEQAVKDARSLMGADNAFSSKEDLFAFSDVALMKGLGYADASGGLKVKFKLRDGRVVEQVLASHHSDDPRYAKNDSTLEWHFQAEMGGPPFGGPSEWISVYQAHPYEVFRTTDESRPLRLINRRFFAAKAIPEYDAFYIQSNVVGGDFVQQFHDALLKVDHLKPRRLIVDLRYNFGGDGSLVPAVQHEFIKREDNRPWKELYILTGRRTLSAGIMAAMAIIDNTENTVIGEPMAAPVNSYGDATSINLERTGLHLDLSTATHQLGDSHDLSELVPVDIPAQFSFSDYASGKDPAVDPILRGEEMRSLQVIAVTNGGAAARKAYADRKQRFSRFSWWAPPNEITIRRAGQRLLKEKRYEDAIETDKLNTELHPDIWNVWYNLGTAQMAAGKTSEALESYRRVLQLDPNNDNAAQIGKAFRDAGVPAPGK